jgi:hypothetical protein
LFVVLVLVVLVYVVLVLVGTNTSKKMFMTRIKNVPYTSLARGSGPETQVRQAFIHESDSPLVQLHCYTTGERRPINFRNGAQQFSLVYPDA